MIKTPLPEKIDLNNIADQDVLTLAMFGKLNQIIDRVAELTEVVEGKQCTCNISPDSVHYKDCPLVVPSLKEQLLGKIDRLPKRNGLNLIFQEEVEAIINRLIK